MQKKVYSTPDLTCFGNIEVLTAGPITPSINDGFMGQGTNTNIGCKEPGSRGPEEQWCDPS